jgi:CheY-like chemotaxis protein
VTKILVIDDDVLDRSLLIAVLEEEGYEVIGADKQSVSGRLPRELLYGCRYI